MFKNIKIALMVSVILFAMVSTVNAIVMTFDDYESNYDGTDVAPISLPYQAQDFEIKVDSVDLSCSGKGIFMSNGESMATLSAVGGSLFTLNSIDLDILSDTTNVLVSFSGYDASGALLATEGITLFASEENTSAANEWITFEFPPTFNNVSYVTWWQGNEDFHQFDNIAINENASAPAPVPEPATCLLFGSGLIGMAGIFRRK